MKLESIDLTNFLSHESTCWAPNGAKLATLVGPNGAGKSALLDGLLYALFDGARGRTDDLVRLGASDMSAGVTFTFGAARYRVTRGRTVRSGGKSFLEFAIEQADGSWRPLTGESIRETQAAIEALLRLDATTFTTAAFLRQGDADTFITATAAERKRVLGAVLGLDVYASAEQRGRERGRALEAELAADRRQVESLDARLAGRAAIEAAIAERMAEEATTVSAMLAADVDRTAAEGRLAELAAEEADTQAARLELEQLDRDRHQLGARWKRAHDAEAEAAATLPGLQARAERIVPDVDVEAAQAAAAALEADLETERERRRAHEAAQYAFLTLEAAHTKAVATWREQRAGAAALVASLEEQAQALEPVTCPKCRHAFPADPGDVEGRLAAARSGLHSHGDEPAEPYQVGSARATAFRARIAADEAQVHEPRIRSVRGALAAAQEAQRARSDRDAAVGAIGIANAAIARSRAEQAEINEAGQALGVRRSGVQARVDAAELIGRKVLAARQSRDSAIARAEAARRIHTDAVAAVERERTRLAALDRDQAERDRIASSIGERDRGLGRLRRLVAAFGVTGIPARIIESVLPELTAYAQELLSELRPGMELSIRAQRATKGGKGLVEALDLVVCDGVGERPLAMFSGGERMSVSLALAVGLSRLVARRAGTAIRTLVIDEPDGLDVDARRAFGQALRVLSHHGELERVVLVSHHEDLADVGDAVYRVSKAAGHGSVVEQVA